MQSVKIELGTDQNDTQNPVNLSEQELIFVGGGAGGISGTGHADIGFGGGISGSG